MKEEEQKNFIDLLESLEKIIDNEKYNLKDVIYFLQAGLQSLHSRLINLEDKGVYMPEKQKLWAICPNVMCNHRQEWSEEAPKFCCACGSVMLTGCPHCGHPIGFSYAVKCEECG
jgi:hypothetical protein